MTKLKLNQNALRTMIKNATDSFPNECCGFLFGLDSVTRVVTDVQLISQDQRSEQGRGPELDHKDFAQAKEYAAKNGLEVLGVYRSKPTGSAVPAHRDLVSALPFLSYLFLSVQGCVVDAITSWQLDLEHEEFYEERLEINEAALVRA